MGRLFPSSSSRLTTLPVFGLEMTRAKVLKALDYVSERLSHKGQHITLLIGGDALSCLHFRDTSTCAGISMLPVSTLSASSMAILARTVHKAGKKFNLGADWLNNQLESKIERDLLNQVVQQSLTQKEIVYSSEGLTLLAVDFLFGLKSKMNSLVGTNSIKDLDHAVALLRRLALIYRGRPLTKGILASSYSTIQVPDSILVKVNATYEWKYHIRGIAGINDEFLGWKRGGRVDLDQSFSSEDEGDETDFELEEQSEIEEARSVMHYAIDYTVHSENSSRACSPSPISAADAQEIENFLVAYNSSG